MYICGERIHFVVRIFWIDKATQVRQFITTPLEVKSMPMDGYHGSTGGRAMIDVRIDPLFVIFVEDFVARQHIESHPCHRNVVLHQIDCRVPVRVKPAPMRGLKCYEVRRCWCGQAALHDTVLEAHSIGINPSEAQSICLFPDR
jgi:hypothetical protein